MSDLINKYLAQRDRTKKTLRPQRSLLNGFEIYLKSHRKNMSNFQVGDVKAYYNEKLEREEWNKPGSIDLFLKVIMGYVNWEIENLDDKSIGLTGAPLISVQRRINKLKKIKKIERPKMTQEIKIYNPATLPKLKEIFIIMLEDEKDPDHLTFNLMYTLCYWGQRPGDLRLTALKWLKDPSRIRKDKREVDLFSAKTRLDYLSYYDGNIMPKILEQFFDNNKMFTYSEKRMWERIKQYSEIFGEKIYPKLGREAFNTYMGFDDSSELYKEHGIHLDDKFTKVLVGHSAKGIDITHRYKIYPPEMIKDAMTKHHYLKKIEPDLVRRV